ncbi:MAG: hypothetical protein ACRYGP_15805, partial [Janthinobacterium lividum]
RAMMLLRDPITMESQRESARYPSRLSPKGSGSKQGLLGVVYENARVLSEEFDADGRILHVRGLPGGIARLHKILSAS